MQFDLQAVSPADRYKLLATTITPRPIAWVTTIDAGGNLNAAPFSFFNVLGEDPPVVGFSVADRAPGSKKDTEVNIRANGEFVLNLVSMAMLDAMNVTAIEFGPEVDELHEADLRLLPSVGVTPPRIAGSPVSLECRLFEIVKLGPLRSLIVGEVGLMHIADEAVMDADRFYIDNTRLNLVGRMQANHYTDLANTFALPRIPVEDWPPARQSDRPSPDEPGAKAEQKLIRQV